MKNCNFLLNERFSDLDYIIKKLNLCYSQKYTGPKKNYIHILRNYNKREGH